MYCSKCGYKVSDGDAFCSKCGNKITKKSSNNKSIIKYILFGMVVVFVFGSFYIFFDSSMPHKEQDNESSLVNNNVTIEPKDISQFKIKDPYVFFQDYKKLDPMKLELIYEERYQLASVGMCNSVYYLDINNIYYDKKKQVVECFIKYRKTIESEAYKYDYNINHVTIDYKNKKFSYINSLDCHKNISKEYSIYFPADDCYVRFSNYRKEMPTDFSLNSARNNITKKIYEKING